jgi:hypothetical protein
MQPPELEAVFRYDVQPLTGHSAEPTGLTPTVLEKPPILPHDTLGQWTASFNKFSLDSGQIRPDISAIPLAGVKVVVSRAVAASLEAGSFVGDEYAHPSEIYLLVFFSLEAHWPSATGRGTALHVAAATIHIGCWDWLAVISREDRSF